VQPPFSGERGVPNETQVSPKHSYELADNPRKLKATRTPQLHTRQKTGHTPINASRLRLKCDGTRAETRFRLSAKRTSQFKSAGASVQSTAGRRAVLTSLLVLYCSCKPVFCSHVTLTGYQFHSVSPSLLHPCVTVCHHISSVLYVLICMYYTQP
jgi:hypothetical protein